MKEKKYYIYEMNLNILNILSLVLFFGMLLLTYFLYQFHILNNWDYPVGLIFVLMIPYLILHEVIHSIFYVLFGADFKNITYGAHLEKGVLCCLCKQKITKKNILFSLMAPFVLIGVVTYIIGVVIDSPLMISLSIVNISGCAGDLIMFFDFLGVKDFQYSEFDNPTAFALYGNEDLKKKKLFGLTYLEEAKNLKIKDLKKLTISKTSIIGFLIIVILGILWMYIE